MTADLEIRERRAPKSRGLRAFAEEVGLGARLAVRGGRSGWIQLTLTAAGLALCVMVLLLGASVTTALQVRDNRVVALTPNQDAPNSAAPAGRHLFEAHQFSQTYQGSLVSGYYVAATDPLATIPPGLHSFPAPGQLKVSPALAQLLRSAEGRNLAGQLPGKITGTIDRSGLVAPDDLRFYLGITPTAVLTTPSGNSFNLSSGDTGLHWGWGTPGPWTFDPSGTRQTLQLLLVTGVAIITVPLILFVMLMSRVAGAARDRRLAAIRLLGASRRQLRRIMAGETLAAAIAGVVLGFGAFYLARLAAPWLKIGGQGFYPADISPNPALALLIGIGVPVLSVITTLVTSQRTIGNPVGVFRQTCNAPRSLWWRLAWLVGSSVLLVLATGQLFAFAASVVLVLISIPILLPYLLQVTLARANPAAVAGQLAIRRMQQDIGMASRVVAGVAVVLAGAIAVQSVLLAAATPRFSGVHGISVDLQSPTVAEMGTMPTRVSSQLGLGTGAVTGGTYVFVSTADETDGGAEAFIGDCRQIVVTTGITGCRDGDAYLVPAWPPGGRPWTAGTRLGPASDSAAPRSVTLPATLRSVTIDPEHSSTAIFAPALILTPGALGAGAADLAPYGSMHLLVQSTGDLAGTAQRLRADLRDLAWRLSVQSDGEVLGTRAQLAGTVRTALILAGLLTLLVSAAGLVVVALEQLTERRRALTLLVATGVPRSLIRRSILIGALVPTLIGTLLACGIGIGLSAYLQQVFIGKIAIDLLPVLEFVLIALVAVLLVTAATLPAVRRLTREESLRTG